MKLGNKLKETIIEQWKTKNCKSIAAKTFMCFFHFLALLFGKGFTHGEGMKYSSVAEYNFSSETHLFRERFSCSRSWRGWRWNIRWHYFRYLPPFCSTSTRLCQIQNHSILHCGRGNGNSQTGFLLYFPVSRSNDFPPECFSCVGDNFYQATSFHLQGVMIFVMWAAHMIIIHTHLDIW